MTTQHSFDNKTMTDIFAQYAPPFDLTSDMLFVLALCPTRPLRRTFPGVRFVSLLSRTPLLLWFSRITQMCYHDTQGAEHCIGDSEAGLYHELNVVAFLREPVLFVPGIYATSLLSVRVGHGYGMPKQPTTMRVQSRGSRFHSEMQDGTRQSVVRARLLGAGNGLAKLVSRFLPHWTWLVRFPSGSGICALIEETPRVQLAYVQEGLLALEAEWLPEAVRLLPVGCYLPGLRMQLPPPSEEQAMKQKKALWSHGMASPLRTAMIVGASVLTGGLALWWLRKRSVRSKR